MLRTWIPTWFPPVTQPHHNVSKWHQAARPLDLKTDRFGKKRFDSKDQTPRIRKHVSCFDSWNALRFSGRDYQQTFHQCIIHPRKLEWPHGTIKKANVAPLIRSAWKWALIRAKILKCSTRFRKVQKSTTQTSG